MSAAVSRISGDVMKCETGQNNRQEETRVMNERGSVFRIDGNIRLLSTTQFHTYMDYVNIMVMVVRPT